MSASTFVFLSVVNIVNDCLGQAIMAYHDALAVF